MSADDLTRLMPNDAIAALRSFPRRYREALAVAPDEDLEELGHRAGPDGRSAFDAVIDTTATALTMEQALRDLFHRDEPVLHPSVTDPTRREWHPPSGVGVGDSLQLLADACRDLAQLAVRAPSRDWTRPGRVAAGPTVQAIDVVREAVRVGSANLRAAEHAMRHARRAGA